MAEAKSMAAETDQTVASSLSCLIIDAGTSFFSSSARARVKTAIRSIIAPRSNPKAVEVVSNRATEGGLAVFPSRSMLKMKGSKITVKRRTQFRRSVVFVSMGRADIILVYLTQIVMSTRKLKPNVMMSL